MYGGYYFFLIDTLECSADINKSLLVFLYAEQPTMCSLRKLMLNATTWMMNVQLGTVANSDNDLTRSYVNLKSAVLAKRVYIAKGTRFQRAGLRVVQ